MSDRKLPTGDIPWNLKLEAIKVVAAKKWKAKMEKIENKKKECMRKIVSTFPDHFSNQTLLETQPLTFRIHSAQMVSCKELHQNISQPDDSEIWAAEDCTNELIRMWTEHHFKTVNLASFIAEQNNNKWFLIVEYSFRVGDRWTIIYSSLSDNNNNYPPYECDDERIPDYQFFTKDVSKAFFSTPNSNFKLTDVSDFVYSCRGPGNVLFYGDTPLALDLKTIRNYLRVKHQQPDGVLVVCWTNNTMETV